jgi:hypothetical protein
MFHGAAESGSESHPVEAPWGDAKPDGIEVPVMAP